MTILFWVLKYTNPKPYPSCLILRPVWESGFHLKSWIWSNKLFGNLDVDFIWNPDIQILVYIWEFDRPSKAKQTSFDLNLSASHWSASFLLWSALYITLHKMWMLRTMYSISLEIKVNYYVLQLQLSYMNSSSA